jgi:hypothetical protein
MVKILVQRGKITTSRITVRNLNGVDHFGDLNVDGKK